MTASTSWPIRSELVNTSQIYLSRQIFKCLLQYGALQGVMRGIKMGETCLDLKETQQGQWYEI